MAEIIQIPALPNDIILEIMKYRPKAVSMVNKFCRSKFNIYDCWILSSVIVREIRESEEKISKSNQGVLKKIYNYIFENVSENKIISNTKEEKSGIKSVNVKYLYLNSIDDINEYYPNVLEIDFRSFNFHLSCLKYFPKLEKLHINTVSDNGNIASPNFYALYDYSDHLSKIDVHISCLRIHDYDIKSIFRMMKILKIFPKIIYLYRYDSKDLDTFFSLKNCDTLMVRCDMHLYNTIRDYDKTKINKKIVSIMCNSTTIRLVRMIEKMNIKWITIE